MATRTSPLARAIPGAQLKPGEPRLTTIAIRPLDPFDREDRYAVLAVEEGIQYVVWTLTVHPDGDPAGATTNGTYRRLDDVHGRLFADGAEKAFLSALGDWLARL